MLKGKCQIQRDSPTTKDIMRQCSVAVRSENSTLCRWQHWRIFFGEIMTTHGMSVTRIYKIWTQMIQRCENPKDPAFKNYGERGITVSEEFHNFLAWYNHIGPRPSPEYTQDRIENDGNYERGNIRWATRKEQRYNSRPISYGLTKQKWFYAHNSNGEMLIENNQGHVARMFGLGQGNISACLLGKRESHKNWKFKRIS